MDVAVRIHEHYLVTGRPFPAACVTIGAECAKGPHQPSLSLTQRPDPEQGGVALVIETSHPHQTPAHRAPPCQQAARRAATRSTARRKARAAEASRRGHTREASTTRRAAAKDRPRRVRGAAREKGVTGVSRLVAGIGRTKENTALNGASRIQPTSGIAEPTSGGVPFSGLLRGRPGARRSGRGRLFSRGTEHEARRKRRERSEKGYERLNGLNVD